MSYNKKSEGDLKEVSARIRQLADEIAEQKREFVVIASKLKEKVNEVNQNTGNLHDYKNSLQRVLVQKVQEENGYSYKH